MERGKINNRQTHGFGECFAKRGCVPNEKAGLRFKRLVLYALSSGRSSICDRNIKQNNLGSQYTKHI